MEHLKFFNNATELCYYLINSTVFAPSSLSAIVMPSQLTRFQQQTLPIPSDQDLPVKWEEVRIGEMEYTS